MMHYENYNNNQHAPKLAAKMVKWNEQEIKVSRWSRCAKTTLSERRSS